MVPKLVWFALFICIVSGMQAQVRLSANVTPKVVAKNQLAEYRLTIENASDIRNVKTPLFKNFNVMGGPSHESGVYTINGRSTRYVTWIFTLRPQRTGTFNIEPTVAIIEGKEYRTEALSITVKNAQVSNSQQPYQPYDPFEAPQPAGNIRDFVIKAGEDPDAKAQKNISLQVEVNKRSCYVGEPIIASYQLLSRLRSESRITKSPSFNGFSVIDLPVQENYAPNTSKINGRDYNVYVLRKAQLYALQPGEIDLEPAEVENDVQFIRQEYVNNQSGDVSGWLEDATTSMLPSSAILNHKAIVRNEPVRITVKPLPEEGKPACFDGAVGEFAIQAALEKKSFMSNESGKLVVVVKGRGNLQLLTAPNIRWPEGIEVYEPEYKEELYKMNVPVSGAKVFIYPFSALKPGEFTVPPICFSFFEPSSGKYKTVETAALSFTVEPGMATLQAGDVNDGSKPLSFINRIFHHRWWMVTFVAAVIFTGLLFWVWRDKKMADRITPVNDAEPIPVPTPVTSSEPVLQEDMPHPLTGALLAQQEGNAENFYRALSSELKDYLSHKTGLKAHLISPSVIADIFEEQHINHSLSMRLQTLMQQIDQHLYMPFKDESGMKEMYDEAFDIILSLSHYTINHR